MTSHDIKMVVSVGRFQIITSKMVGNHDVSPSIEICFVQDFQVLVEIHVPLVVVL